MHVFRHDDIPINAKPEAPTHAFQDFFEDWAALGGPKQDTAMIATERYKMTLPGVMKTFESGRSFPTQANTALVWATRPCFEAWNSLVFSSIIFAAHMSQHQHVVPLILRGAPARQAVATGNNAAWHCECGRTLPLVGRSGDKSGVSEGFWVDCPDCSRRYCVVPDNKDHGRVLEVR